MHVLGAGAVSTKDQLGATSELMPLPNICQGTESIGWLLAVTAHSDVVVSRSAARVWYRLGKNAALWLLRAEKRNEDGACTDNPTCAHSFCR